MLFSMMQERRVYAFQDVSRTASIERVGDSLQELSITNPTPRLNAESYDRAPGGYRLSTFIEGQTNAERDTHFLIDDALIPVDKNGRFKVKAWILGENTQFVLSRITHDGTVTRETMQVMIPQYLEFRHSLGKTRTWSIGLAMAEMNYQQTNVPSFSQIYPVLRGGLTYRLGRSLWSLGLSGYLGFFALNTSDPRMKATFIGLNVRAGKPVWIPNERWSLSLWGGLYHVSIYAMGSVVFGFRNVFGPQFYPSLSYTLDYRHWLSSYFKFSPITNGTQFLAIKNFEAAFGAGYYYRVGKERHIGWTIDVSYLNFSFLNSTITTRSISLGATYGL